MILACVALVSACSSDTTYKIKGVTDLLEEGDTLFLTTDIKEQVPFDTLVVIEGQFLAQGHIDTTAFALLYSPEYGDLVIPFFLEAGSIEINIAEEPGASYVKGTPLNEKWMTLKDSINALTDLASTAGSREELEALNDRYIVFVTEAAEANVNNDFGYFLLITFEDVIETQKHLDLINALPANRRGTAEVKAIEEHLLKALSTAVGHPLQDIILPNTRGKDVSLLEEARGNKLTIIDFWASWCGPCRQEMPNVVAVYADYKAKGLGVIGVSFDSDKTAWERGIKDLGITWTQVSDLQGWQSAAAELYAIRFIPQLLIVDSEGMIVAKNLHGDELRTFVDDYLK